MRDVSFLWPLFRRRLGWMLLSCVLAMITVVSGLGLLAVAGWLLAGAALAGSMIGFELFRPAALLRLFALTRTGGRYADRVVSHEATFRLLADVRIWFYEQLAPRSPGGLARFASGDLLNRLVADIQSLDNLFLRVLVPSISAVLVGSGLFILLGSWSWLWASAVVGCLILSGIGVPALVGRLGAAPGVALSRQLAAQRQGVVDLISGLPELLVYQGIDRHLETLQGQQRAFLDAQSAMNRLQGDSVALQTLLGGLALWLLLFLGIPLVSSGELTGPLLLGLGLVILAAFEVVQPLPLAYQYLGQTRTSAQRLGEILQTPPPVQFVDTAKRLPQGHHLSLQGLSFRYPSGQQALHDLDLHLNEGDRVAVVGPSGAGKSTLAQLLVRFIDPDSGSIQLGGVDLRELPESVLRQQVGMVSQRSHLFSGTLRENLLMARPDATESALLEALRGAHLEDFVAGLPEGLDTWLGEAGMALSGGQIRRVAVARMLLRDPPILILDEPTEGLDGATATALLDTLVQVMQRRSVLLITHRLQDLTAVQRVLLLEDGRCLDEGPVAELCQRWPQLAELDERRGSPC